MKSLHTHSSNLSTKVVAGLVVASQVVASAEEVKEEVVAKLDETTVIATKFEKDLSDVSSSVAVLDADALLNEGKVSVQDAIGYRVPGVIATSTAGQRGQAGSLFIRGMTTNKSQMRLDGVRVSDSTSTFAKFLGSSNLYGLSNIEVLKGAASSVYGAGAIGGVVALNTAKGEGKPMHSLTAEYGSFNSWLGNLSSQGQVGGLSYNVGLTAEDTQNDSNAIVDGNDFTQLTYYSRFDYAIDSDSSVGLTLRGGDADSETPERGNPVANTPQVSEYNRIFATLFYENQISEAWNTRVTLGFSKEDFESRGYSEDYDWMTYLPLGTYSESNFDSNTERYSIYWDNEYVWSEGHTTVVGSYFENSEYESTYQEAAERDTFGVYVNHSWQVIDSLQLNGTLGWDDHDDFGDVWTWNAGASYNVLTDTAIKANVGKGFRAPTFGELDGNDLDAESSLNWDFGVEQEIGDTRVSVTWFENDIEDFIEFQGFDPSTFAAVYGNAEGKTKTNGLELGIDADIEEIRSVVFASYTYYQNTLDAIIPQQTAAAGIDTAITSDINAGLVATWVDQRTSSDQAVDTLDSYFLIDLYSNYQVTENLKLHARIENLFDEHYILGDFSGIYGELNAVQGRGRGFYGGVTLTF
ncbi:TonB-dependent receptor domain-containing protein [Rubritalea spongiae]|uniref:TonB-dependent receptor domain-containing protein n=1 Tax=Rubritalea spongiae TaxID=430797 RepID=A0ABW5E3F6_9BACT